jgi:DNA polymerase III sliding clamp (beta) subunit (PCNA family)
MAELKSALTGLGKIIAKRCTLPVLGNVEIERTKDGWTALTGTDLDHHVTVRLEQPGENDPAVMLVPYDELFKTCKACGNGDEILVEKCGEATAAIKYRIGQQVVETKVESLPVGEFPEIPRIKSDAVALPDTVRQSIHEALQCASTDETRLILNGAYLDVSKPEANYVVGTDGRHLFSSNSFALPMEHSLIIPAHKFIGWKEFNSDGEWQLKVLTPAKEDEPGHLQISSRRWRYIARQIEGNYPNWRQVVPGPDSFATTVEFGEDIEEVLQTIQRMPCDDAVNFAIGLEWSGGELKFLGRSPGAESWTGIDVTNAKCRGKDVKIFFNRNFLTKALQFGLTKVETIDAMSPLRLSNGGRQMIVMPTRPDAARQPTSAAPPTEPTPAAAQQEPTAPKPPPQADQPKGESMPEQNGTTSGTPSSKATTSPEKPALEIALAQTEVVRGEVRNAAAGLNKLGDLLKQIQRENKASEKEIQSVRHTLRSLQTVRI